MPELPEVARFKQYLDETSLHQKILGAETIDAELILQKNAAGIEEKLTGHSLVSSRQWGKQLMVQLSNSKLLVFHFGMTAYFEYYSSDREAPRYAKLILQFASGYSLAYVCVRKLGSIGLYDDLLQCVRDKRLGPHALDMGKEAFVHGFDHRKRPVKSLLMDQSFIAGIGNEYADEFCFACGIFPAAIADDLPLSKREELYQMMNSIFEQAIREEGHPNGSFYYFRKKGEECPKCLEHTISRMKIGGRSTYYCPHCQAVR